MHNSQPIDAIDHAPPLSTAQDSTTLKSANGGGANGILHPVAPADGGALEADDYTSVEGDVSDSGVFDPGSAPSGLEVDSDPDGQDGLDSSVYAFSTYPRIQEAFQVEHPFNTTPDSATM
jgi:hypothetical protein